MENNNTFNKTIKLYDDNAYATKFEAIVIGANLQEGMIELVLDKTLFFPEEGGQTPDKGTILLGEYTCDVLDVQIRDGVIFHYCKTRKDDVEAESVISRDFLQQIIGEAIQGEVDFEHRFSNMQQHSAEHIFSGFANKYFGCENVGFHLSDSVVTFDYDKPLKPEDIEFLETKTNECIYQNVDVKAYYPSREELEKLNYRSKKEIDEALRIVEVVGVDICACCAPHVAKTGEIGICKVIDYINYKGGVRISILCGSRALEYIREQDKALRDISHILSAAKDEAAKAVERVLEQRDENKFALINSNRQNLEQLSLIVGLVMSGADAQPKEMYQTLIDKHIFNDNYMIYNIEDVDSKVIRNFINGEVKKYPSKVCGAISKSSKGYSFVLSSENVNCKDVYEMLRNDLDVKGGGLPQMVQGNLEDKQIDLFLEFFR